MPDPHQGTTSVRQSNPHPCFPSHSTSASNTKFSQFPPDQRHFADVLQQLFDELASKQSEGERQMLGLAVGMTFGYHIVSTWHQTHPNQSDLHTAGFVFSTILLPFANFICVGACLAIFLNGKAGLVEFLVFAGNHTFNEITVRSSPDYSWQDHCS